MDWEERGSSLTQKSKKADAIKEENLSRQVCGEKKEWGVQKKGLRKKQKEPGKVISSAT